MIQILIQLLGFATANEVALRVTGGAGGKRSLGNAGAMGAEAFRIQRRGLRQLHGAVWTVAAVAHDAAVPDAQAFVGDALPPAVLADHGVGVRGVIVHLVRHLKPRPKRGPRQVPQKCRGDLPTVAEVARWIADLGGYTGKSSGGPFGAKVLSRGLDCIAPVAQLLAGWPFHRASGRSAIGRV